MDSQKNSKVLNLIHYLSFGLFLLILLPTFSVSSKAIARAGPTKIYLPLITNQYHIPQIAFYHSQFNDIWVMNSDGTNPSNVTNDPGSVGGKYSWSPDGQKIAFWTDYDGAIYTVKYNGTERTKLAVGPTYHANPVWSPDGNQILFVSRRDGNLEIYIMNADGSGQTNLTNHPRADLDPTWSPDGNKIAFSSSRNDPAIWKIYKMNADGSGQTNLTNHPGSDRYPTWSPDGTKILFLTHNLLSTNIYTVRVDGTDLKKLTNHSGSDSSPTWSPDGTKIAFHSDMGGTAADVFVMNEDGTGLVNLTSDVGGISPAWSPDGSQIAFISSVPGVPIEVFVMNSNGTEKIRLTFNDYGDGNPSWRPP